MVQTVREIHADDITKVIMAHIWWQESVQCSQ